MTTSINIEEVLSTCQTGDILLFNTYKVWFDTLIQQLSGSKFSHIGIILRDPTYIDKSLKGLYFLESGHEKCPDVESHQKRYGVELVPLEEAIKLYRDTRNGYLYYRKLDINRNKLSEREESFEESLLKTYSIVKNKPYDFNPWDWIRAYFKLDCIGKVQRTDTFWCSALVSFVYVHWDLLKDDIPWTLLAPKKFSYYEGDEITMSSLGKLEPEKWIIF